MEEGDNKKDKIEQIKDQLYSKNMDSLSAPIRRHSVGIEKPITSTSWDDSDLEKESSRDFPFLKVFLAALIFFIVTAGFAFYKFFFGTNIISGDNINVVIQGPVSIGGGENLSLLIDVINNNTTPLESVNLHIEYPSGVRSSDNISAEVKRYDVALGDIAVGKKVSQTINNLVFGEENTKKDINVSVDYRIPGSSGTFEKKKTFSFLISSSPVNITVTNSSEVNANQNTDFNIKIQSNSLSVIKGLTLKAEYPFGFDYKSSDLPLSVDNNIWNLGDFEPGATKNIKISGLVMGQDNEEKVFKFTVGIADKLDNRTIATNLASFTTSLFLRKSFVGLTFAIDGDTNKIVAISSGEDIKGNIVWTNNLPDTIYDLETTITMRGNILDKSSVSVKGGIYRSLENSIIFNKETQSTLSSLLPGASRDGSVEFQAFSTMSKTGSTFSNPEIIFNITVQGRRTDSASTQKEIFYSETKTARIISNLSLLSRGYYYAGPFSNSGPIPPRAEKETTYTVTWTATNPTNNVKDTKVTSSLPPYMKWTGKFAPNSENISYDSINNQITWNIGNIQAGVGTTLPAREVSFQVSLVPSLSQVGASPDILNSATITGVDSFTGTTVTETKQAITTDIKTDPNIPDKGGVVGN